MILDIQERIIDGKVKLFKFAPISHNYELKADKDGYLSFDLKDFAWQPVKNFGNELNKHLSSIKTKEK